MQYSIARSPDSARALRRECSEAEAPDEAAPPFLGGHAGPACEAGTATSTHEAAARRVWPDSTPTYLEGSKWRFVRAQLSALH